MEYNYIIVDPANNIALNYDKIEKYKEFKKKQLEWELAEKEFKKEFKEVFEKTGKTSIIIDGLSITYKKPTTRTSVDSKRLKMELPDIFEEYSKTSEVAGSVTIKVE